MQGRALNRQEQQLRTEALLSGMGTEGRISAPTPAEQRAQAAAERAQIAGSVGGQTARALLSTPFDTPETRQKIAQTGGQFLNRVARGFGGTLANVPMGIGASTPVVAQAVEQDMAPVQAWLKRTFPTDAEQKDFVNAVLPETAGSLGAFMLGSLAGGGSTMSAAMMGALVNAGSTYEEVRQRGFSRENAIKAARFGRLIGAGEAFGVGRVIDKLAVARPMLGRALNTGEEGVQELISGWLNNANAKYASGYDPERALTEGLDEQLMGGLAGGALVETLGMGLAGLSASRKGGANKVPDAFQTETGPAVQPPTGQFGGVIPPSAERQAYETWTQAGGPRAPEAYQVLRKSRSLPGQLGLPPVGLPPVGMPEGQAPQRPTAPLGLAPSPTVTPRTQVPTQPAPDVAETEGAPFTFRPLSTVGRPEARPVSLFERPILQTTLEGQGAPIAQRIEEELPLIRDEYAETGRVYQKRPRKGEVGEEGPTAGNVRGEYGKLAYFMHRTPSGVLKKAVSAYDLEPTEKVEDAYEPVMNAIVADMQQIVPGVTSSDVMASAQATAKARRALPPEVANIWESWYERFGQDHGFTESDLNNLKELTAGRRGPFFRPDVQAVMGVDPGDVEANKQTQTAIRQDLARLMKMPYDEISLTTVPPAIWQNWMSLRGLNDERQFPGLKAQMQEIFDRYNEEVRGVKPSPPSPPSPPAGAAPTTPTRPTPPPPAAPAAPTAPTAPSPLVTRYQSQVGRGVSRAPLAFQPRSYTEGVASMERARAEREEARQARERLKKGSPFAKARQAEEARIGEVIEGRRPEPPAATEPVTPKPTPPAPPAPAGEAVTPDAMKKAGIDVPFMESLAKKYGLPPSPVKEAAGIYGPLGRAANMLERAASKSKSSEELAEILQHAQRSKAHRAVIAVARNPNTDEQTFEQAIKDKEANKYASPSYWEGIRAERAERASTGKAVTPPPAQRKATPAPAPKPAPAQPISEKTLTERGWNKQDANNFTGPNGEKLQRDPERRGQPWVYTDRSGNTQSFDSGKEAIKAIISEPEVAPPSRVEPTVTEPTPSGKPTPTETAVSGSAKTTPAGPDGMLADFAKAQALSMQELRDRISNVRHGGFKDDQYEIVRFTFDNKEYEGVLKGRNQDLMLGMSEEADRGIAARVLLDGDAVAIPPTTQAAEGELPVAEFSRQQEQVAARREAFLKDNPDLILTTEDYVKTLAPDVQQKYAKYKALQAKFEAAKQAGSQVRFGATSGKQLKELTRELEFISREVGRAKGILSAVIDREPVSASTVDALGVKLPEGYQRQGNQFVFEEGAAPQTAQPIDVPKIQKVLKGLRSGPMVDFTTIAGFKDSDLVSLRQYALKLLTGREMSAKDATFKRFMAELATALNVPVTTPGDTVKAVDKVLQDIEEGVITASTSAKEKAAPEVPTEVKQIFDTLDSPQGKKSKTRKSVEAMNPDLGKKAIFVNDNIEQIIAEAEANGKVTKECP
jgi:hypothetical protein